MSTANLLRLIFLAAIWGGSFLFMRIAAPVLGAAVLIEYRVLFAALFLAVIGFFLKKKLDLRAHWKHYLILGLFNSAIPFLMFAFAARTLSASVLAVLNATTPLWGTLIAAVWSRHMVGAKVMLGLALGTCGVALLVGFDHVSSKPGAGIAIAAVLFASFNYGIASNYAKQAKTVEPFANAHGSMWASALLVLPVVPFFPAPAEPTIGIMGARHVRFDHSQRVLVERVIPHLSRALTIGERLLGAPLPDAVPTLEERLRLTYCLTLTEARVAIEVGLGKVPKEVATTLGTSWNTVRSQLRKVFAKTRTTSQAELARLIARLEMAAR